MSFRISRHRWLKIAACALALGQLWGCASSPPSDIAIEDESSAELADLFADFDAEPVAEPDSALKNEEATVSAIEALAAEDYDPLDDIAASAPDEVLPEPQLPEIEQPTLVRDVVWHSINGGPQGNVFTGITETRLKRPVAVAARSKYIYVVDQGQDALFRIDQADWRMELILDLRTEVKGQVADIYVAKDLSFYLTDTDGARVIRYDAAGRRIQVYRNHFNLVQPVAVTELDTGDIVVADAYYDQLLHFNPQGVLIATYGARGAGVAEFTNITSMAAGPDGYYVGSRVGRKVQVVGPGGKYLYSFEEGGVIFPSAIVVSADNRSYVADQMDSRIKVFERGILVSELGQFGAALGQFKRVSDLWLEDNILYVADSLNGRIQWARMGGDESSVDTLAR